MIREVDISAGINVPATEIRGNTDVSKVKSLG